MDNEHPLRRFIHAAADAFFVHDLDGLIVDVNANACRRLGYRREALLGRSIFEVISGGYEPDPMRQQWSELLRAQGEQALTLEGVCRARDGTSFPAELRVGATASGDAPRVLVLALDATARKRTEARLSEHEQIFRRVFDASEDAILLIDGETFVDCNAAAVRMLRCTSKEELLPAPPWRLSPERQPDGRLSEDKAAENMRIARTRHFHRFEWLHTRADGENFPAEVTLTPIDVGGRQILHVIWKDITERKQRERQIESLAHYDPLTGLPNRRLLQERAQAAIALAARHHRSLSVLYMDLNRFKDINDTQGHDVGDALLIKVAQRIQGCLRGTDTAARLGGDEFAFLLPETGPRAALEVAERLVRAFDPPFEAHGISAQLGASIGVVSHPRDGTSLYELLKHADIAMYEAKGRGLGHCAFRREHAARIKRRYSLEQALRQAIDQDGLSLHYQPRVAARDGSIRSVEALARWHDPERGWIPPVEFIPVAEASGLIHAMGRHLLEQACRQAGAWRRAGIAVRIAVNVTVLELQRSDFVAGVLATLERCGVGGDALEIEITESTAMTNPEDNIATLAALKDRGIHIAIDDFGTGYSSLNYLKRLPVDSLKVDQSFIRDMTHDATDAGIVASIISLAHSMDLATVAEGVETAAQWQAVCEMECDFVQGYLISRPGPAAAITQLLRTRRVQPRSEGETSIPE